MRAIYSSGHTYDLELVKLLEQLSGIGKHWKSTSQRQQRQQRGYYRTRSAVQAQAQGNFRWHN